MRRCFLGGVVLIGVISLPIIVFASGEVRVSEIAWMGSSASANDEWIELENMTDTQLSLEGWELSSEDGQLSTVLRGSIMPRGFYLLERTDDNSAVGVSADQWVWGLAGSGA